jgi:nitrile hydratase beta subunit
MDGVHDLGGMEGFGPVERDEDVFHAEWERRAFALAMTAAIDGNTDDFRHAIERLDPGTYLTAGYYGRWLASTEVRLAERGLLSSDEVDRRAGRGAAARPVAAASLGLPGPAAGGGARRSVDRPPRFAVGDAVHVADVHPRGHTRLPRSVRDRHGLIEIVHPAFVFPDTHAHGWGEDPQHVYAVRFAARDLWGEGDHFVFVDIFESHLEAA